MSEPMRSEPLKKQLYDVFLAGVVCFITAFKTQFPEVYSLAEEHYLRMAWGGTKAFTMAQQFLEKHGLDTLLVTQKEAKRTRFFRDGTEVREHEPHEMVLYETLQADGNRYDTKRFDAFDEMVRFQLSGDAMVRAEDVKMLGLQLVQKDTGRKFELTLHDNWFIEGNVLFDPAMTKHLLREQHRTTLLDSDEYEITFIDGDMNVQSLTETQFIRIEDGRASLYSTEK